jgi:hypothetical protein
MPRGCALLNDVAAALVADFEATSEQMGPFANVQPRESAEVKARSGAKRKTRAYRWLYINPQV